MDTPPPPPLTNSEIDAVADFMHDLYRYITKKVTFGPNSIEQLKKRYEEVSDHIAKGVDMDFLIRTIGEGSPSNKESSLIGTYFNCATDIQQKNQDWRMGKEPLFISLPSADTFEETLKEFNARTRNSSVGWKEGLTRAQIRERIVSEIETNLDSFRMAREGEKDPLIFLYINCNAMMSMRVAEAASSNAEKDAIRSEDIVAARRELAAAIAFHKQGSPETETFFKRYLEILPDAERVHVSGAFISPQEAFKALERALKGNEAISNETRDKIKNDLKAIADHYKVNIESGRAR